MKNVALLTEDGAFALFFRPQLKSPHPREFAIQGKKMVMPGSQPRWGGGGSAQLELTDA